jgi:hypothetical protein
MISLSKIKNKKNILVALLMMPMITYSMDSFFVPAVTPSINAVMVTAGAMVAFGAKMGFETVYNSPMKALIPSCISGIAGFAAYKGSRYFTPEAALEEVKSIINSNEKGMNTKVWKIISNNEQKSKESESDTNLLKVIEDQCHTTLYPEAQFWEKDLQPKLQEAGRAELLIQDVRQYAEADGLPWLSRIPLLCYLNKLTFLCRLNKTNNTQLLSDLQTQEENFKSHLDQLKLMKNRLCALEGFKDNVYSNTLDKINKLNVPLTEEKIKSLRSQNSYLNTMATPLFSNSFILESIINSCLNIIKLLQNMIIG